MRGSTHARVHVEPAEAGRSGEMPGAPDSEPPAQDSQVLVNVAKWPGAHFYNLPILYLLNTHLLHTLHIAWTKGQRRTSQATGVQVFDRVEAVLQHIDRRELIRRHLLHGQP